jgi:hypothetical protein
MTASAVFVFDASPLVAGCKFSIDGISVAVRVLAGVQRRRGDSNHDEDHHPGANGFRARIETSS